MFCSVLYNRPHLLSYGFMRNGFYFATYLLERMRCACLSNPQAVRRLMGTPSFDEFYISHLDIPLVLSKDSTQPVTLHVAVTVSASATSSPIDPIKSIAANVGNPAAEGAIVPSLSQVSSRATGTITASTEPLHVQTDAPVLSQTYATGGSSTTGGVHDSANKTEVPKSGAEAGAVQSSDVSGPVNSEPEKTIDEIIETIGRSVRRSETELFLLTEVIQIS